ncbi:hypothetical protein HO133_004894 [Letharia lupina]|uniref:Uncharacterized protein n=1 Tax=Letharia lupina TaxID=560253 RepID=A0A8H6L020_9LECA|nr:uncharacterized protein HO133_004894 [Letharia lupina]KAF6230550.1 hypothetical protein HO133_004894 [Letharia lupina]
MLRTARIRAVLVSLVREFNRSQPRPWYDDPRQGFKSLEDVTLTFINSILMVFPTVYIDDSIGSPSCLGAHPRREWRNFFHPREQSILLNGPRVRDMGTAAIIAARTGNPSDHANKRFRTFIFMFANTFFHEMAHMLVTFLTQDLTLTPPNIGPRISGYSNGGIGEAGRWLETTAFGGTLEYYRDHSDDGGQPGIPHILTEGGVRRISQHSIDDIVSYCDHYPPVNLTDPMRWIVMDEYRRHCQKVDVGPQSALAQLPFQPGLRAQAA